MNSDTPRTNEEIIDAAHCAECGYEVVLADAMRTLERELTELGKEREADKEKYIQAALARDKQATEDRDALESIIESLKTQCALRSAGHDDLRTRLNQANQQLSQLKRELAEAQKERDQLKRENENTWRAHGEMFSRNLAISAAYQRQKEALNLALRAGDPEEAWEPIAKDIQDALAETPDVSLWEKIQEIIRDRLPSDEAEAMIEDLLSTLQPDHQK